ncbi:MAG: aminomethyl-transferring glycine dehydrogenase subunit GcvPB [Syntrophomonadaceae bacterium]|nr:aminomethyl-transferring glycine dehydrogenase subunit GcvPB [Syntrophomonadaceae bacterium]
MARQKKLLRDNYHQARWDESIIFEMSVPGERGVLVPLACKDVVSQVGDGVSAIPTNLRRKKTPALPEINQMRVNRHFYHLSQETLGTDVTLGISEGTCTMKYSPKVQEHMAARHPGIVNVHPLQDPDTMQGVLEIYYQVEQFLKEISGMDAFSLQPGGGAHGVYANASMIRAYHRARGDNKRTEIITTMFSHPCDAATPNTAGFKVITLMPDESGYPDLEAMKAALSERTAGIMITNPEDTGIYNPRIEEYVKAAHSVGAICSYDQANANGMLGIHRAREAGFDMVHFNLHKTFSAPHGCMGPATGAIGVKEFLKPFLPVPRVEFDGQKYILNSNYPESIGKVRSYFGNTNVVLKAYMWIMQHGAEGLKEAAICSVLNNQYFMKKIAAIPGVVIWYAKGKRRLEQVRYSWEKLKQDTGAGTDDVNKRIVDFGIEHYWTSHHPWVVPEPFTLEPCESYNKEDLDEYIEVLQQISKEAYADANFVKTAPHKAASHRPTHEAIDDAELIAVTWRQYQKKKGKK